MHSYLYITLLCLSDACVLSAIPHLIAARCTPLATTMNAVCTILAVISFILPALAQSSSCSTTLTPANSVQPSVASGYRAQLIATGLSSPRSIRFDKAGNLLVVEQKKGNGSVSALTFQDNGGTCLSVTSHTTLVTQSVRSLACVHLSPIDLLPRSKGRPFIPSIATSDTFCS